MSLTRELNLKRGDTERIPFQILDTAGEPLNTANVDELFFTVKAKRTDDDDDALIEKTLTDGGIEVVDAADGRIEIIIDPADTSSAYTAQRGLLYDIQMVHVTGDVTTLYDGLLNIVPDITRRTSVG